MENQEWFVWFCSLSDKALSEFVNQFDNWYELPENKRYDIIKRAYLLQRGL